MKKGTSLTKTAELDGCRGGLAQPAAKTGMQIPRRSALPFSEIDRSIPVPDYEAVSVFQKSMSRNVKSEENLSWGGAESRKKMKKMQVFLP